MCGRVILTLSAKMIEAILNDSLDINDLNIDDFIPRYNISPGQNLLSIIQHKDQKRAGYMKWQFVPTFAKSEADGYQFVNARSESIHEKSSFKDAFQTRRCIVLCNGFYEWHRNASEKTAHFFHNKDHLIPLGGIWNAYTQKDGSKNYGFSLITTEANQTMSPVHHRMPVIIPFDQVNQWLNKSTSLSNLQVLMRPMKNDYLSTYEVSNHVNKIHNDDNKCIEKVSY
jgi:putative SOS response-associated peptidase YedK